MKVRLFGGLEIAGWKGAGVKFAARKLALVMGILVLAGPKGIRREQDKFASATHLKRDSSTTPPRE